MGKSGRNPERISGKPGSTLNYRTMHNLILHIRESSIWGSPERLILGQIRQTSRFTYIPVTYRKRGRENPFARELRQRGLKFHELIEYFTGDLTTVFRLVQLIHRLRPALVVTHEYKSNLYGYLALRLANIPHIVHFHGFTAEDARVRYYNAIDAAVMRRARAIITVSARTKDKLKNHKIDGDKIAVVINAVPESAFEKKPFDMPDFEHEGKLIVSAGRLSYEKGFDIIIDALEILKNEGIRVNTLIYGDGPERKALCDMIDAKGLSGSVKITSFSPDLRPPFGAMEFLVIPSRSEGFPLVLLEAWAQGAPVVAMPVGGLPDLIIDNENGILAERPDPQSLAEAMKRALSVDDFKSRCGEAGKRLTVDKYNFNVQVKMLEEIYSQYALET
jgi:glycosyltransferase involved in cell wall biosynthesis